MGCVQSYLKTDADIEELYTLDKCIGQGVEGEVFLATSTSTGDQVAVKLVPRGPDLGLGPEKVRREIQLQARLDHVNIVELKQVILTRRHLAIVMSYEGGGDLHSYASKYKLNEEVARYFFRQIVEGVSYCHRSHIAHRDLKLANFLLTTDKPMRVKLCDFGCARKWQTKQIPDKRIGRLQTFAGTPAYMSPQVLQSAFYPTNTYDAVEADVWALGIVLCHLFFGKHTPFWLEPNAFRNEGMTMQARIEAMKQQNWVDSDEFVKANVTVISPELRDLLDKIFVADEFKRITIKGIKEHPWYTAELPPFLQDALDAMAKEQALRDSLQRAAVSLAANRHDTGVGGVGDFATIDLLVDLAQRHRKMPGGSDERVFCLDMAHMDIVPISRTVSDAGSFIPGATAGLAGSVHLEGSSHLGSSHHARISPFAAAAAAVAAAPEAVGPTIAAEATDEGTQHSSLSYASSLERVAHTRDTSNHLKAVAGEPHMPSNARFRKTLSLQKSDAGLLVGSYVLQPSELGTKGAADAAAGIPRSSSNAATGGWIAGMMAERAAEKAARSVHGGIAFFNEASVRKPNAVDTCTSKTVHGGTAHAAALAQGSNRTAGIFYQG